jgi:DNA-3-methyladenine glycosylase II
MPFFNYGHTELSYLKKRDKILGKVIDQIGMIEREIIPDLFTALIYSIISQQISAKASRTVFTRLENHFSGIYPEAIAEASIEEIQQCGLSFRKAEYIKGIGEAVKEKRLDLSRLVDLSDNEVIQQLISLKGVGKWTAEMLLIFSMQRMDVVSYDDLAIQRGMKIIYGLEELSKDQFEKYRKIYSPYGSVASLYLWAAS